MANSKMKKYNYGTAILAAFEYLLDNYPEVFVIGQGLWSPWYVGNSMTNLDKKFGVDRVGMYRCSRWRIIGWDEAYCRTASDGFYAICYGCRSKSSG
jgi:hypothetical protein